MSTKNINEIAVLSLMVLALFVGYCIGYENGEDYQWQCDKEYVIPAMQAEGSLPVDLRELSEYSDY